jgi:site-specific recombinase XerD
MQVVRRATRGFVTRPTQPRVEEIIAVMRRAGETDHGLRLRALIVVLWRAGLRSGEAMALTEPDLDPGRGSILVRQGKGGKRREVGMDDRGFDQLEPWLARRLEMPVGTLFCVIDGQTRGRPWTPAAARNHLRRVSTKAGVRRRSLPWERETLLAGGQSYWSSSFARVWRDRPETPAVTEARCAFPPCAPRSGS